MGPARKERVRRIPALKVHQWLPEWDQIRFDAAAHRRRPSPHFYLFTLPASELRALSGIYRRTTADALQRSHDLGIQRRHDVARSDEIREFVRYGYPWSELNEAKRKSGQFTDLQKPGWLPTAIVVNILEPTDFRQDAQVSPSDIITVSDVDEKVATINLPELFTGARWRPSAVPPIEIIDGQHRLWAFEAASLGGDYDLPVVAYHGLDISWQAYLFWTINIKPKRINASLAFDLYPLLRTEDWLEKFEGHSVYRETRAQELTEALWAHPESPWYQRINMLGETGLSQPMVSQAAWIRSLMATYVKHWESKRTPSIGGLFGAPLGGNAEVLPWSRAQQAAFLIRVGQTIQTSVETCTDVWAQALRNREQLKLLQDEPDSAFAGSYTLLNTDQGIRGILYVTNDLCYVRATQLGLKTWIADEDAGASDEKAVTNALKSLRAQAVDKFLQDIAQALASYDWRTSSAPGLTQEGQLRKGAFRGSGGYKELRRQLLRHLAQGQGDTAEAARKVVAILGY